MSNVQTFSRFITAAIILAVAALIFVPAPANATQPDPEHKVTICHKGKNTIEVDEAAVPAHLAHGDSLGPCEEDPGPNPGPDPGPPGPAGNNGNNGANGSNGEDGQDALSAPSFEQDNEQEADSGDLTQNVSIEGGGDNSNQMVGNQLVGNTGNVQTQTNSLGGDVDAEDSGSSLVVSPSNSTSGTQEVNQTAIVA